MRKRLTASQKRQDMSDDWVATTGPDGGDDKLTKLLEQGRAEIIRRHPVLLRSNAELQFGKRLVEVESPTMGHHANSMQCSGRVMEQRFGELVAERGNTPWRSEREVAA